MPKVYRLEHRFLKPDRLGISKHKVIKASPYRVDEAMNSKYYHKKYSMCDEMASNHAFRDDRPTPSDDGLRFKEGYDICASPTYDALYDWFEDFMPDFIELGFVIREYQVKKRRVGKSGLQCLFKENDIISSKIIESKSKSYAF